REFRDAPQSFALVVTDLLMPDLSGVDVARAIKEARADCPVVLTTGYAAEHDLSNAPVDAIVDKPVPADQWARVFRETLPKAVKAAV
ncbi:MAG: response regulator, partial [Acidobacteriota bacterium]